MAIRHKKKSRYSLWYIVIGIEVCITAALFVFSPHGLPNLHRLTHEKKLLQQSTDTILGDIRQLQTHIAQWQSSPFYREQLAREQLQMAYADEIVYYVTK